MPGAGTRTATTTARPAARCLDLTRLISRVGRGPATGVDRVELAYLTHLIQHPVPLFCLIRTALGYLLLDQNGSRAVADRLTGVTAWGPADLIGHLTRKAPPAKRRAEADLRRLAIGRCPKSRLSRMLRRHLLPGAVYLNVGHSNLNSETLAAFKDVPGARITVLIHDTIPLDYPQFQRAGTPELFFAKLRQVSKYADLVIYNSAQSRADAHRWFATTGRTPVDLVSHLGVDPPRPDPLAIQPDLDLTHPYFMTVGTIEPRKNHALLLDVWEAFSAELPAGDIPNLFIIGSRGWENEELFTRLDASPLSGHRIFECANVGDPALSALLARAAGLLCPSFAEGFGLPPVEAAALNIPVICTKLPVFEEVLGNIPVYLPPDDVYSWMQSIIRLTKEKRAGLERAGGTSSQFRTPTWVDHFNLVLKVT